VPRFGLLQALAFDSGVRPFPAGRLRGARALVKAGGFLVRLNGAAVCGYGAALLFRHFPL
jgi:hypothetical protein